MPIKKVKSNSNGKKLPTAKDYKLPKNLSQADKQRIASSRAALEAIMKDKGYEVEKTGL